MEHAREERQRQRQRSVCLFGLSADPPTGAEGHVGIVRALRRMRQWDELWVLPVYRHTYSDKRNRLVSFEHRLAMCRAAFEQDDDGGGDNERSAPNGSEEDDDAVSSKKTKTKVVVSDAERESWRHAVKDIADEAEKAKASVGTATLLDYLNNSRNDNPPHGSNKNDDTTTTTSFSFCLGADAFLDLLAGKWKESARVLQLLDGGRRLVVLHRRRGGDNNNDKNDDDDNNNNDRLLSHRVQETGARLLRVGHLGSISSSQVRACTSVSELRGMVVPQVLDYMRDHRLYQFATATATATSPKDINDNDDS